MLIICDFPRTGWNDRIIQALYDSGNYVYYVYHMF
jgi:hypothetical protein